MRTPRKLRLNASKAPIITDLTALLGSGWTSECTEEGLTSCTKEGCPRIFIVVLDDNCFKAYDKECEDICTRCEEAQPVCNWLDEKVDAWGRVEASYKSLQAEGLPLNSALSAEAAQRVKNVFKMAQEAVELPRGFRYTAFRENKSENMVLSTLMYTSAKLGKTQWVMKSALMAQFAGEEVDGSRTGEIVTEDAWAFQPDYDPERGEAGRDEYIPKAADKLYNFVPNPNSSTDPDRQAAYWLVGILSDMIDDVLNSPPNRVYEFLMADGLLRKKNLAIMEPGGLIRLINKDVLTGPEVLKAKPSMWKKLLEKGFITGEQAYKSQPNQLAWLAIHDYIPVERALKIDPSIQKQLERYGKMVDATPEDLNTDIDSLVGYVTDGVLTPQKAWSINPDVLKPLVEASLVTAYDAYKLDPSILNWMLENHHIGRAEATRLKPRIKQEMDRKGVDWETLEASTNASRKLNANYDYPDEDSEDVFYVAIDDDLIIKVEKRYGRWYESVEWEGEDAREFKTATYMGYLTHEDIKTWIRRDFPNAYIRELSEDEYYDFIEEQEYDDDWEGLDGSRKLNSSTLYLDPEGDAWEYVRSKDVLDFDGFRTTYTWFQNEDGTRHIFMLTDDEPDPNYADFECESYEEARDWFESYEGFEEDLDSSRRQKTNAKWEDIEPGWHSSYPDWAYGDSDPVDDVDHWEYIAERWVDDAGVDRHYVLYGNDLGTRYIITYDDGEYEVEPSEDNAIEEFESYKEAKNYLNSLNSSRRLNCAGYEDMNPDTFRQAVEMLDPDSSAWDDLDELCEVVGYYPDDVGGWGEWFSTLEYDDRCTAWDFVSWVLDEDLDSARRLNCSGDESFYVSINMGEMILRISKSAHGEWAEEVVYRDEEADPYFVPSTYMGYLSPDDILYYLKNDFSGSEVNIISEEVVDDFLGYDDDWDDDEDLDSARRKFRPTNINDLDDLKEQVESTVYTFLTQDPMVNFDDDFVKEYSAIEITNTDDGRVKVEVRADISFDNLMRLAEKLNKLVTEIDKESYFDAVEPGILVAYIEA